MYTLQAVQPVSEICEQIKSFVTESFTSLQKAAAKEKAFQEDIKSLKELLSFKKESINGWNLFKKPIIVVQYIGRDEYKYEDSKFYKEGYIDGR